MIWLYVIGSLLAYAAIAIMSFGFFNKVFRDDYEAFCYGIFWPFMIPTALVAWTIGTIQPYVVGLVSPLVRLLVSAGAYLAEPKPKKPKKPKATKKEEQPTIRVASATHLSSEEYEEALQEVEADLKQRTL